jgi:hypothetical protein
VVIGLPCEWSKAHAPNATAARANGKIAPFRRFEPPPKMKGETPATTASPHAIQKDHNRRWSVEVGGELATVA